MMRASGCGLNQRSGRSSRPSVLPTIPATARPRRSLKPFVSSEQLLGLFDPSLQQAQCGQLRGRVHA